MNRDTDTRKDRQTETQIYRDTERRRERQTYRDTETKRVHAATEVNNRDINTGLFCKPVVSC